MVSVGRISKGCEVGGWSEKASRIFAHILRTSFIHPFLKFYHKILGFALGIFSIRLMIGFKVSDKIGSVFSSTGRGWNQGYCCSSPLNIWIDDIRFRMAKICKERIFHWWFLKTSRYP